MSISFDNESIVFTKYLINTTPTKKASSLYASAVRSHIKPLDASTNEAKILALSIKYPFLIPYLDAGLTLISPHHELRYRLYLMLSILESDPVYADKFLPKRRSALYIFVILLVSFRAIMRAAIGIPLIKVVLR